MFHGQDIVMVVLGIAACFAGYSMFRTMLPLWGFLLGGWIAYTLAPTFAGAQFADTLLFRIGSFVIGGLIGAIISIPLYFVIIFLTGAALGMLMGIIVGAIIDVGGIATASQVNTLASMSFPPMPQTALQFLLMVVFGLILGGIAISFQKFMIIASSSFIGAAAIISGLTGTIALTSSTAVGRNAVMMIGWILVAFVGIFIQFRMMGEV